MIVNSKESNKQASLLELLGGNAKSKNSRSSDLFSKLLGTLSGQSQDGNSTISSNVFKAVIDPKNTALASSASLNAVTKSLQESQQEDESSLISKELLGTLSDDQVHSLIYRAKEHLKSQITAKSPEYQNETESLPKTLAGLIQLADKLGLEPQTITLSSITEEMPELSATVSQSLLSKPLLDAKSIALIPSETAKSEIPSTITQLLSQFKTKESEEAASKELSSLTTDETDEQPSDMQPLKDLLRNLEKKDLPSQPETVKPAEVKAPAKTETLITLLQGEQPVNETESDKSETPVAKTESSQTQQTLKADSFEVKTKEAQQSMRLFATDLKEAVESYKPPFTRLSMKLNPEKLGEVEVTLVQRGNNVHVNIQSTNPNSVAFLAHNATELKAQLAHQGVTNATMNFMSGGDGQPQQQNQQQNQNRFQAYQSLEELTINDEQLSALEIIIPNYA